MPFELDAADDALGERQLLAGNIGPDGREHALHAGARVRRAADDLHRPAAGVDDADLQPVGVGMLLGLDDRGDDEAVVLAAGSSTNSTSSPTRVSVSTISASEAGVSRWSLSQERVNFINQSVRVCALQALSACRSVGSRSGVRSRPVLSPQRSMLATLMSSSMSGQWIPSGESSSCDLCPAVAAKSRGYHQRGVSKHAAVGQGHGEVTIVAFGRDRSRVFNLDLQNSHSKPPTRRRALGLSSGWRPQGHEQESRG